MKIALIGQTLNTNFKDKLSGGIQAAERLHVNLLQDLGHEVVFVCSKDTEEIFEDVKILRYSSPSEEGLKKEKGELTKFEKGNNNRVKVLELENFISQENFDLIIIHAFQSSYTRFGAKISKDIPTVHFLHNNPENANDIGIISRLDHYRQIYENGGSIVCVSPYSRDLWREFVIARSSSEKFKFLSSVVDQVDKMFKHFSFPSFTEKYIAKKSKDHCILITRPDPVKNPVGLLKLWLELKHNLPLLKIYLAYPGNLEENQYFNEKMKPILDKLGKHVEVFQNSKRDVLLSDLETSLVSFVPCYSESASIVAIESGARGVPVIAFSKNGKHAASTILRNKSIRLISENSTELDDSIKILSSIDRDEIAFETYSDHSRECRKLELLEIINSTRCSFKDATNTLLYF